MVHELYQWMLSWSDSEYAIPALFLLAFAESSFFPLPPDVLLMALTLGNPSWGMYYAAVSTVGSVLGGMFGYVIGWFGGRPILLKFMGPERVATIHAAFEKYEGWAILIAGFTPIPYKIFTIGAGAFYVNFKIFVVASLISRGARFFIVAGTLQLFGPWIQELIERYFNLLSILFVVLLGLGFWMVKHQAKKTIDSHEPASEHSKTS